MTTPRPADEHRLAEPIAFLGPAVERLTAAEPGIVAVALVGSWARGTARPDSDVDLVVLATDPTDLLSRADWYRLVAEGAAFVRAADFGAILERRLRLPDGLEVEVGIGLPSWAGTQPLDAGTRRVVADGLIPLYDPERLLRALLDAV